VLLSDLYESNPVTRPFSLSFVTIAPRTPPAFTPATILSQGGKHLPAPLKQEGIRENMKLAKRTQTENFTSGYI